MYEGNHCYVVRYVGVKACTYNCKRAYGIMNHMSEFQAQPVMGKGSNCQKLYNKLRLPLGISVVFYTL